MSKWRVIIVLACLTVIGGGGWVLYGAYTTWRGIPDAYAAWDTGILIIEYLETHDDQWPRSWYNLLSAKETLEKNGKSL